MTTAADFVWWVHDPLHKEAEALGPRLYPNAQATGVLVRRVRHPLLGRRIEAVFVADGEERLVAYGKRYPEALNSLIYWANHEIDVREDQ